MSRIIKCLPLSIRRSQMLRGISSAIMRACEYPGFVRSYNRFKRMAGQVPQRHPIRWSDRQPCLAESTATTGYDRHYVLHTAWAARVLAQTQPALHIDISSSLHFVTLVSAFVPIHFFDYRPAELSLSGLTCQRADLTSLSFPDASVSSISCMHVLEHIGLGRYGDPLDPQGDLKAMRELARVTAPGGTLLVVVPVGEPRIAFNAHRIYTWEMVIEQFPEFQLESSALIPDDPSENGLVLNPSPSHVNR